MDSEDFAPPGSASVNSSTRFLSSLMGRSGRFSRVFKTIQSCFLDSYTLQRGLGKPAQAIKNLDTNIFRGRNVLAKLRNFLVQVLMVEGFDDFAVDKSVKVS